MAPIPPNARSVAGNPRRSATLRQIDPRLITASLKGFGSDGPYADDKSFEAVR